MTKATKVKEVCTPKAKFCSAVALDAMHFTISMFKDTPFKSLMEGPTRPDGSRAVMDVPFYETLQEVYNFISEGRLEGLEAFKKKRAEAAKSTVA